MKRSSGNSKPRVRVVWDEQNLDFLEASKTPKQKINEPKTPYHAPEAEDGLVSPSPTDECVPMADAVHAEAIRNALSEVASTSEAGSSSSRPRGSGWTSSEDDEADMDLDHDNEGFEANGRRWSFEDKRRAHYDEYRKAKMLSGRGMSDEEADMGAAEDVQRHNSLNDMSGGGGGGGGGSGAGGAGGGQGGGAGGGGGGSSSSGSCSRQIHQDHESSLSRRLSDSS